MDPLPQYWRTTRAGMVTAWGWSTQSADEALTVANERLAKSLKAIRTGLPRDRRGSYGWAPPREETLQELRGADGDVPPAHPAPRSLRRLLRRTKTADQDGPKSRALQVIQDFAGSHSDFGVRAYETFAGFRVIITGSGLAPKSPEAAALFEQLGTDQIYVHLCRKYNTCRARLTPKPWRCGLRSPSFTWPPSSDDERARMSEWLASYQAASSRHATCRMVGTFGPAPRAEETQIIELHDHATRTDATGLPLA